MSNARPFFRDGELDDVLKQVLESVPEDLFGSAHLDRAIRNSFAKASGVIYRDLRRRGKELLKVNRVQRHGFCYRLEQLWGPALGLLEMLVHASTEVGDIFDSEYRQQAAGENDYLFEAIVRLHCRACGVSQEVLHLLRGGFAAAAHARWRTLHEVTVVATFLLDAGKDCAERYLLHEVVESTKALREYQHYCQALSEPPFTGDEVAETEGDLQALKGRFGPEFLGDYGWTYPDLPKGTHFNDIERAVNLDSLRTYYRLASHAVHANTKGVYVNLGAPEEGLLAGASNRGLEEAGIFCVRSLMAMNATLMGLRPSGMTLLVSYTLLRMERAVTRAFEAAEMRLDRRMVSMGQRSAHDE